MPASLVDALPPRLLWSFFYAVVVTRSSSRLLWVDVSLLRFDSSVGYHCVDMFFVTGSIRWSVEAQGPSFLWFSLAARYVFVTALIILELIVSPCTFSNSTSSK